MINRKVQVQAVINGEEEEFLCEPRQSLLEVLRETLGLPVPRKDATTVTAAPAT